MIKTQIYSTHLKYKTKTIIVFIDDAISDGAEVWDSFPGSQLQEPCGSDHG